MQIGYVLLASRDCAALGCHIDRARPFAARRSPFGSSSLSRETRWRVVRSTLALRVTMQSEAGALRRVKSRLARLSEKLRREGDDDEPPHPQCHLFRHILHRGSSLAAVAGGDSGDSDSELASVDSWRHRRSVGRALSDTDGVVSCESEDEPSPLAAPHLTALLLGARARKTSSNLALNASVAECSLEASLAPVLGLTGLVPRPDDGGANSAPEISTDQTGLLEKLGQRIRQRSDRVHRVMSRNAGCGLVNTHRTLSSIKTNCCNRANIMFSHKIYYVR